MDVGEIALEALNRIAQHEKECSERWSEATFELRELRLTSKNHADRWERLAWFVIATTITCAVTILSFTL